MKTGSLFVVGGKDGRNEDRTLLKRFLELCGGSLAPILIVTAASSEPERHVEEYSAAFAKLRARKVSIVHPTRENVDDPALLSALDAAAGVYFSGGAQRKLVSTLEGSRFHDRLRQRHRRGLHVGGTSAGAAALSNVMLSSADGQGALVSESAELSVGLGLLPDVIVDQHFSQRKRIGRLMAAVVHHPSALGFGVDETTAAEIDGSGRVTVLGKGLLTVIDGSELVGALPCFAGLRVHRLGPGWRYDLKTRRAKPPSRRGR